MNLWNLAEKFVRSARHPTPEIAPPTLDAAVRSANKGVGLLTMVKDEDIFLIHWLTHYARHLEDPRFYIIDDASETVDTAGVIRQTGLENLCSVLRLPAGPFSDSYKARFLSSLAAGLLERHAIIIVDDVDEIVTPIGDARAVMLDELLSSAPTPFVSPIGVLPVHEWSVEEPFDPYAPLAGQRAWGFLHGGSTKPIIWKGMAGEFTPGLHTLKGRDVPVVPHLATMHLRFVDRDTALLRQERRNRVVYSSDQKAEQGSHWRTSPKQYALNNLLNPKGRVENAPDITAEAPRFMQDHMAKIGEHFILKERKILRAVKLTGSI